MQMSLRRQLISQSILPILQLVLAFFIVALLIFILGMIASSRGGRPPGILGFTGAAGSAVFLLLSFGTVAAIYLGYRLITRGTQQKATFDALWLRLPGIGPCLEAIVMARFTLALQLTNGS